MGACIFCHPNRADGATLSGGSWAAAMPVTNMLDPVIGVKARTVDKQLANTQFDIDLDSSMGIRALALVSHNLSAGAIYRVRASATAGDFSAPAYDSDWVGVWPATFLAEMVPWESDAWWDSVPEMTGFSGGQPTLIHLLSADVVARYWRVEINDVGNGDGYIEIGRLFIGPGWQPSANFSWGASIGYEDDSAVEQAWSGTEYFDRRTVRRAIALRFEHLSDADALQQMLDMQRIQGVTREILFLWDPDDTQWAARRSFLARSRELTPIEYARLDGHMMEVKLREII